MTQTDSKIFLKKNKQEISAPKTKSPTEKTSPVKPSVQKAESTLPETKEQKKHPETVLFNSPSEIVEKETSVELEESQNYLSNIQFNFKGDFKLEKFQSKNKFDKESIISGNVISISDDFVGVDVGYKSIALIPKEQFADREGNLSTEIGKKEEIYVERLEDSDGQIKASKKKYRIVHIWKQVQEAYKKETTIEGTILEKIKGGMRVDVGVNAFLPDSQVDLKPILNLEEVMGKTFDFKVLKYNKKRANIVISRRALLEMDRLEKRAENLKKIKKGNIVKGIVKNITDYGAFVDIGGIDGLLHITDITWTRISHPSEVCSIGDTIEVMIMDFDLEQNKVSLGLKQKTADPWEGIKKYKLGSVVIGKIASITSYGIFIEIEEGVEGLVHNTEMSWSKKTVNIDDIKQKIGDEIKSVIKEIDKDKRRISLSVKELTPNPWNELAKTIKKDSIIEGIVQNVTEFGVFITLHQGVDGLVHISDIDWNNRQKALIDVYEKGQKIKVKVLSIDSKTERLALGIKQLTANPWIGIEKKLAAGDLVKGTVQYISEFGLFVETTERVEGLLHINKMDSSLNSKEQLERKYAVGDTIGVKILKIDATTQKLAFILPKSKKIKSVAEAKDSANPSAIDSASAAETTGDAETKTTQKQTPESLNENSQEAKKADTPESPTENAQETKKADTPESPTENAQETKKADTPESPTENSQETKKADTPESPTENAQETKKAESKPENDKEAI